MERAKKKKAILLGAISPFCDLVREMADLNIEPIICDYYSDAPAKKMSYPSYEISTTDVDAVLALAKKEEVDGVVCAFSDRNLMPAHQICEALHLNHFFSEETIDVLTDKEKMKRFFRENGCPVVNYGLISFESADWDKAIEAFRFPVITKPIDAYGSKGIYLCETAEEVRRVSQSVIKESLHHKGSMIVEEYYLADEISISAWVKNGRAYITCVYDVFRNIEGSFTLSAVAFPSKYTEKELDRFDALVNQVVSDMSIEEGPVTLQCFIGPSGIKLSELLCRLAGGSPYAYPTYFGGPDTAKMLIAYSVGDPIDYQNLTEFKPVLPPEEVIYHIQVIVNRKGKIRFDFDRQRIMEEDPGFADLVVYYSDGDELVNVGSSGVIFARIMYRTRRDADFNELAEKLDKLVCAYGEDGVKSSFIRRAQRINVTDTYEIDWAFLKG